MNESNGVVCCEFCDFHVPFLEYAIGWLTRESCLCSEFMDLNRPSIPQIKQVHGLVPVAVDDFPWPEASP